MQSTSEFIYNFEHSPYLVDFSSIHCFGGGGESMCLPDVPHCTEYWILSFLSRCVNLLRTNFFFFCKKNSRLFAVANEWEIVLGSYVKFKGNLFDVNLKINNVKFQVQIVVLYTTFPRNAVQFFYWARSYSHTCLRPIISGSLSVA